MSEIYDGGERRGDDRRGEAGLVLRAMDVTQQLIAEHEKAETERMRLIDQRIDDMQERMGSIVTLVGKYMETHNHVMNAFPGGDIVGHKEAHQAWIKETERRAEFWQKMKLELAKWGLLAFVGWVCIQLWHGFLKGPQ
jgi:hypothetical protein